jgi:hypothetical protein
LETIMTDSSTPTAAANTPVGRVIGVAVGLALLVGTITLAFAWPSADMGPNEVPIAVIGPEELAAQTQDQLDEAQPDAFDVTAASDPGEAQTLIEDREVYAALQIAPEGVTVYTASAASPTVARLVAGMADQIAAQMGQAAGQEVPVTVEDGPGWPLRRCRWRWAASSSPRSSASPCGGPAARSRPGSSRRPPWAPRSPQC